MSLQQPSAAIKGNQPANHSNLRPQSRHTVKHTGRPGSLPVTVPPVRPHDLLSFLFKYAEGKSFPPRLQHPALSFIQTPDITAQLFSP